MRVGIEDTPDRANVRSERPGSKLANLSVECKPEFQDLHEKTQLNSKYIQHPSTIQRSSMNFQFKLMFFLWWSTICAACRSNGSRFTLSGTWPSGSWKPRRRTGRDCDRSHRICRIWVCVSFNRVIYCIFNIYIHIYLCILMLVSNIMFVCMLTFVYFNN